MQKTLYSKYPIIVECLACGRVKGSSNNFMVLSHPDSFFLSSLSRSVKLIVTVHSSGCQTHDDAIEGETTGGSIGEEAFAVEKKTYSQKA